MNTKSDDYRKYCNLSNTNQTTKQLFTDERTYLKEINDLYNAAGSNKKAKEVLLHNIKNIQNILEDRVKTSTKSLQECREEYRQVQRQFDECMNAEKEHF